MINEELQKELRDRFNPDGSTLRKHQLCILDILKHIHALCVKHNIKYYLSSGTLLGAVRHGGFIPWDDDLDLEMSFWDYRRFIKIAKKELPEHLVLHTHSTDSNYFLVFAKIRDQRTFVAEHTKRDDYYKYRGAFVDVLYTEKSIRLFIVISRFLQKQIRSLILRHPYSLMKILCTILYFFKNYILYTLFRIINIPFRAFLSRYFSMGSGFFHKIDNKEVFPLGTISFEGHEFYSPKDPDAYLTRMFKDYETLPDLDRLLPHCIETVIPDNLITNNKITEYE